MENKSRFVSAVWAIWLSVSTLTGCNTTSALHTEALTPMYEESDNTTAKHALSILEQKPDTTQPIGFIQMCQRRSSGSEYYTPENDILCERKTYKEKALVYEDYDFLELLDNVKQQSAEIIEPNSDEELYNKREFWTYPIAEKDGKLFWDCDDYVMYHIDKLKQAGVSDYAMRPMMVKIPKDLASKYLISENLFSGDDENYHLVLVVFTDTGMHIMDNLRPNTFVTTFEEYARTSGYELYSIPWNTGYSHWKTLRNTVEN